MMDTFYYAEPHTNLHLWLESKNTSKQSSADLQQGHNFC